MKPSIANGLPRNPQDCPWHRSRYSLLSTDSHNNQTLYLGVIFPETIKLIEGKKTNQGLCRAIDGNLELEASWSSWSDAETGQKLHAHGRLPSWVGTLGVMLWDIGQRVRQTLDPPQMGFREQKQTDKLYSHNL